MTSSNQNESAIAPAASHARRRNNRGVAAGLTVGLLGGAAAGLVFGMPGLTNAAASDAALPAAVVQQSDPINTPDAPPKVAGAHVRETLQPLIDDGTITAEQADAVAQQLLESRPERTAGEGRGPGGHRDGPGLFGRGVASEALTDLLGIDARDLRTQLQEGSTLAEIATAQGVEPQAVVDELVAEVTERTNAAVESGRIDQAKADELLVAAGTRITDMVENGRPERD